MTTGIAPPPDRLETERLVLRCWTASDAPRFKRALDASLLEMRPWIDWTRREPSEIGVIEERLAGYERDFHERGNALYAILDTDEVEVLGGIGLYRRVGPGALEVGYWIRSDQAGRGLATEATRIITEVGLALAGVERLEIHCDPRNGASVAIPRKLGYHLHETRTGKNREDGEPPRETMVWMLEAQGSGEGGAA
jgi:RimJ/RimL family protein N-acetyltransferase